MYRMWLSAWGLGVALAGVGCDPTTLRDPEPDQAVDAEIDMELDLGPSACERACAAVFACAASDDFCPGVGPGDEETVVGSCLGQCEGRRALATEINRQEACDGKVAFFRGADLEFETLCRFGRLDAGAGGPDAGDSDADAPDADAPDAGAPDLGGPDAQPDAANLDAGSLDAGSPDAGPER